MSLFDGLSYVSTVGTRAAVGHPTDDPYVGNPASSIAIRLRNEGPCALEWLHEGQLKHRRFATDIQAVIDPASRLLVVVGHGCGSLEEAVVPDNGGLITESGSFRRLLAPTHIESALSPSGARIAPDGFSAVEIANGHVEIWISYWDGEWMERRAFDPDTGRWGNVSAHLRVR